jgi:hypothetical protein
MSSPRLNIKEINGDMHDSSEDIMDNDRNFAIILSEKGI